MRVLTDVQKLMTRIDGIVIDGRTIGEALRSIPRTGKALRIDAGYLNLPKQSLADHIYALGHMADVLLREIELDRSELARTIVFHDLAEILTGDVPDFTVREIAQEYFKTPEEKMAQEAVANQKVLAVMPPDLQSPIVETSYFKMLDKCEPIVAIWRYLTLYHDSIEIEGFLSAMSDFFMNPKILPTCVVPEVKELVRFLQSPDNARQYFDDGVGPDTKLIAFPMHTV